MDWFTKDQHALTKAKAAHRVQVARAALHGFGPFDGPGTFSLRDNPYNDALYLVTR